MKDSRPQWRRWLGDRLGTDFFEDVVDVYLGLRSKDAGMESVGRLDRLEHLVVGDQLSDAGLVHLRGLTRLKTLYLESYAITGAGLKNLEGLTRLERLDFCFVPVDDAGLAHLKGLSSLKALSIPVGDRVTDAGLAHLEGLSSLEVLHITDSLITDAGLASVARLTRLKELNLRGSKITDAGIGALRQSGQGMVSRADRVRTLSRPALVRPGNDAFQLGVWSSTDPYINPGHTHRRSHLPGMSRRVLDARPVARHIGGPRSRPARDFNVEDGSARGCRMPRLHEDSPSSAPPAERMARPMSLNTPDVVALPGPVGVARYKALAFFAALAAITYLDRICMAQAADPISRCSDWTSGRWAGSSAPSRSRTRSSRSRPAGSAIGSGRGGSWCGWSSGGASSPP